MAGTQARVWGAAGVNFATRLKMLIPCIYFIIYLHNIDKLDTKVD